jgi:hypothetical protein
VIVVRDDLWLCVDCMMFAVNGDTTGIDNEARETDVQEGVSSLGAHVVPDFDTDTGEGHEEFACNDCDACHSGLAGEFYRFAILGDVRHGSRSMKRLHEQ